MRRSFPMAVLALILVTICTAFAPARFAPVKQQLAPLPAPRLTVNLHGRVVTRASQLPSIVSTYTVRPGDTLTSIAAARYGSGRDWPALWWANRSAVKNPDLITVGEILQLRTWHTVSDAKVRAALAAIPPPPAPAVQLAAAVNPSPQASASWQPQPSYSGGDYGTIAPTGSAFEQCVITRESGGNSQVMNSTGHYGLFQFDFGTWVSGGGAPGDFGHASVAEQQAVFNAVYAARGAEPWAPSDGC
jgi:Transglycosylase-like domain/LysM domain